MNPIPASLLERLYKEARADQWAVSRDRFADALRASLDRAAPADARRYLQGLHLEDLALACACAGGEERAWDHFVKEYRPVLYRAADTLDPSGGAREIADSTYAELYAQSLFRYYHGRSSLKTWLRAVLAQRHVDAIRAGRRIDPLPDDEEAHPHPTPTNAATPPDPDRLRYRALIQRAFKAALARLSDKDRLRLACYYSQELTLAQTGRILKEHEATVSRQLAKTRHALRLEVERRLRDEDGLTEAGIEQCFAYVLEDPGPMDLGGMLRKNSAPDRSI